MSSVSSCLLHSSCWSQSDQFHLSTRTVPKYSGKASSRTKCMPHQIVTIGKHQAIQYSDAHFIQCVLLPKCVSFSDPRHRHKTTFIAGTGLLSLPISILTSLVLWILLVFVHAFNKFHTIEWRFSICTSKLYRKFARNCSVQFRSSCIFSQM